MEILAKLYWIRIEKKDLQRREEKYREKLEEMEIISASLLTGMPSGNNPSDPTEKYVLRLQKLKEKMQHIMERISEIEVEVERYIEDIEDSEIRTLVRKYYVDGLSWNEIAKVYYKKNIDGSTPRKKVNNYFKTVGR